MPQTHCFAAAGPPSSSCRWPSSCGSFFLAPSAQPQFLLVTRPKGPLLLFQEGLYVRVDPGFVVGETPYSPGGYSVLHTEVYVVGDVVCEPLSVLLIRITQYIPLCSLKTVRASTASSDHPVYRVPVATRSGEPGSKG